LMGLRVVTVEVDRPFLVDIDLLKQQLTAAGSTAALAQIAKLSGAIQVNQIDSLRTLLASYRPLINAARGSIRVLPGDFADPIVQQDVAVNGPFDHIICTDVINPMKDSFSTSTAAFTTGDDEKTASILN